MNIIFKANNETLCLHKRTLPSRHTDAAAACEWESHSLLSSLGKWSNSRDCEARSLLPLYIPECSPKKDSWGEMVQMYTEAFCKMLTSKPEVSGVYPLSQLGRWRHNLFHTANIWKQNSVSAGPEDHPQAVFLIAPFRCCFCTNSPKPDHKVISNSLCSIGATVHRKRRKAF